ncbi:type II toxin-antitoxin system VapC family toxin [Sporichthya sp.]|uniref:type II toxin-antitoxin system VapC family toxin n=1 Tax=Sporichthya sp. TaxID=65475 RepID=UPI0025E41DDE|nr:type II toxin-antitoxin system VapC family toxin [Sporichthya sp.]
MSDVLVDTAVWIDHLRRGDRHLVSLLDEGAVLGHPWVVGEVALGSIPGRSATLGLLAQLPQATAATPFEVMAMIETRRLFGTGLSLVDAHLLASTLITPGARLWTRDRRLRAAAEEIGRAYVPN